MPDILSEVKTALRITHNELDGELATQIAACKLDLEISGIQKIDEADPMIRVAIIRYCKTNFGYSADKGVYQQAYDAIKNNLRLARDRYGDG